MGSPGKVSTSIKEEVGILCLSVSLCLFPSFSSCLPLSLPQTKMCYYESKYKNQEGWDKKKRQHAGGKSKISLSDKKKLGLPPYATFKVATCPMAGQSSTAALGWPKNHKRKARLLLKDPWIVWSYRGSPLPSWRKSLFKKDQHRRAELRQVLRSFNSWKCLQGVPWVLLCELLLY